MSAQAQTLVTESLTQTKTNCKDLYKLGGITALFKLIYSLITVIITAMQIYKILMTFEPQAFMIVFIVIAGISPVALFLRGAFMSTGNASYQVVKTIHNSSPVVVLIALGLTIYLLTGRIL